MTTTTDRRDTAPAAAELRVTQLRVLTAEAIKFRSLRSNWWLVVASVLSVLAAGVSPALITALTAGDPGAGEPGGTDAVGGALSGVSFTQLLIAALGILVVTGEYTTGSIRTTFTAVPGRLPVLWAKAVLVAVVSAAATLAAVVTAFFTAQAVLGGTGTSISLGTPGVPRAIVGAALYLGTTAVLGAAVGALLRSAVGAMAAVFGLLFVLPVVGLLVPQVDPFLPTNAGAAVMQTGPVAGETLPPWAGLGVFALYAAVALAAAALALARRDT
ncbi:ABC-type transport system involved in multi-copper enzyme maturation permease subunit [Geodermatophilus tzadiensis]|uniref:ABC-type transport system involved in multi-copper enzyme maturation permease subunit n=1 Tax=Geodermatophilus tzadiensis TaxID=1137988 RepID=A0A2T0TTK2_9ACTN|nr:ABC transporter permease subunit [Geodermatophilus tzadiensis]PRY48983.1 ABC-type transport system involved in multi-copper enzyme maturation permease subunit [Geodermatophilus tzadiensis]